MCQFERGTVSYAVSATVTRPTTMAPVTACSRKVYYKELIDIGSLPPPKPRVVTLEPVDRGSKSKLVRRFTSQSLREERSSVSQTSTTSTADASPRRADRSAVSNAASEVSTPTIPSGASSTSVPSTERESALPSEPRSSQTSPSLKVERESSTPNRTITASVQLSRAGCLPGEVVPITVTVHHTKSVKSVKGVIATLFRQARVDMHPNLPLAPTSDGKKTQKYEDYYPRSKTGLGGLSLSAAGSSQVWRKDLSQTFAPLYVDPVTMSTIVKLNIRVPDDAFATMRSAPGDMITFRYYVEVIVDIHGKLSNQGGLVNLDVASPHAQMSSFQQLANYDENQEQPSTIWGSSCIDTAPIRREKNAVTCNCELVIGTKNSAIVQGNRAQNPLSSRDSHEPQASRGSSMPENPRNRPSSNRHVFNDHTSFEYSHDNWGYHEYSYYQNGYAPDGRWDPRYDYSYHPQYHLDHTQHPHHPQHDEYYPPVPPPILEDESALPEKERLRRAEARLLPSRPPDAGDASPHDPGPSAPFIPDENDFETADAFRDAVGMPPAPFHDHSLPAPVHSHQPSVPYHSAPRGGEPGSSDTITGIPFLAPSAPSSDSSLAHRGGSEHAAPSPPCQASEPFESAQSQPRVRVLGMEDKHDVERQLLQSRAGKPTERHDSYHDLGGASAPPAALVDGDESLDTSEIAGQGLQDWNAGLSNGIDGATTHGQQEHGHEQDQEQRHSR